MENVEKKEFLTYEKLEIFSTLTCAKVLKKIKDALFAALTKTCNLSLATRLVRTDFLEKK